MDQQTEDEMLAIIEETIEQVVIDMKDPEIGVSVKTRNWLLKSYKRCFVGSELVTWIVGNVAGVDTREDALTYAQALEEARYFKHVTKDHPIKDGNYFYVFTDPSDLEAMQESKNSWSKNLGQFIDGITMDESEDIQPFLEELNEDMYIAAEELDVLPLDEWNTKLLDNTHPSNWVDPDPENCYNIVVIGAGAGGLITAAIAAGLGAKVALIEKHLMGGDCLNVGCVPSKALIRCAEQVYQVKNSERFGVIIEGDIVVDFPAIMERMRKIRADISPVDSAERYQFELGVDVFIGEGVFTSKNTVDVNGTTLKFAKSVIATGARAAIPPIKGLENVKYLTNATIFNLTELPVRFGVIGTGAIGCEMAQTFRRFGSKVTCFSRSDTILSKEDPDAVQVIENQFRKEGIKMRNNVEYRKIRHDEDGRIEIHYKINGENKMDVVDQLLIATGRKPNVEGMGLENCGVKFNVTTGVKINDLLQTTNPNIYAVGDCCSRFKFTHMADSMARMVIRNCLFFGGSKVSQLIIPWSTYTHPEIAHVGPYESDLIKKGLEFDTYQVNFDDNDRSKCDGTEEGFVRIYTKKGTDTVFAGTIVGEGAGNMISIITTLIQHKIKLGEFASVIHPYPTTGDAVRRTGDLFNRTKLSTFVKVIFRKLLAARR